MPSLLLRILGGLWVLALLTSPAAAKVLLSAEVGFEQVYRPGQWTAVYLTVSDSQTRGALLQLTGPRDSQQSILIRQQIALSPQPATYAVYLPLTSGEDTRITLLDPANGKTLFSESLNDLLGSSRLSPAWNYQRRQVSLGLSGRSQSVRRVAGRLRDAGWEAGVSEPLRLPSAAVAYQGLDALVLDAPDFNTVSTEQQQAIADWVRAGGVLVVWPGTEPWPATGPLIDLMPARPGEPGTISLSEFDRSRLGVRAGFSRLTVRQLQPSNRAARSTLAGGAEIARQRVGFGHILLLAFDAGLMEFDGDTGARQFWRPLLSDCGAAMPQEKDSYSYYSPADARRSSAVEANMDLLGSLPGMGSFGFSYVAFTLLGLMLVVGPVDWLLLRYLGRLPWTWATTTLWIVLVSVGAIFLGQVLRSGELHYRSLRIADQADNTVIFADMVCLYSPRTTSYELSVPPETWWQPLSNQYYGYYGRQGMARQLRFHQVNREQQKGNYPLPMRVPIWNLQFLEGESLIHDRPLVQARLRVDPGDPNRLVGTVSNLSPWPMHELYLRCGQAGAKVLPRLEAGATVPVRVQLGGDTPFGAVEKQRRDYPYGRVTSPTTRPDHPAYPITPDLAVTRSQRIDWLLKNDAEAFCLYAQCDAPDPPATLADPAARQQHWLVVRALGRIGGEEGMGR